MELEIYEAFRSAGISDEKAKAVVKAIVLLIDQRFVTLFQKSRLQLEENLLEKNNG